MTVTRKGKSVRLVAAAAAAPTDVILADSGFYVDYTAMDEDAHAKPPALTILQRRTDCTATLYGNAVDLSGQKELYVKSVSQEGSLEAGYGLLKVTTSKGTDLFFASYRLGTHKAGGMETDAAGAMVPMDGTSIRAMYLGGGTRLAVSGALIERGEPRLAYVEKLPGGSYVVGNPSPTDATAKAALPGTGGGGPFSAKIKAGGRAELGAAAK